MLILKLVILFILLLIAVQDFKYRAVSWFLFPVLPAVFITIRTLSGQSVSGQFLDWLPNMIFLSSLFSLLTVYFSIKGKVFINITRDLLGWGDIWLLLGLSVYFSFLNFLLFFVGSLILVIILWFLIARISGSQSSLIPLAGMQAALAGVCLGLTWWAITLDITRDDQLIKHFYAW